jgi:hypothetical protein
MIRSGRSSVVVEHSTPSGIPIRLAGDMWWVLISFPAGGAVFSYRRPRSVEMGSTRIPIHDHTGIIQVVALAVLVMSLFAKRFTR